MRAVVFRFVRFEVVDELPVVHNRSRRFLILKLVRVSGLREKDLLLVRHLIGYVENIEVGGSSYVFFGGISEIMLLEYVDAPTSTVKSNRLQPDLNVFPLVRF